MDGSAGDAVGWEVGAPTTDVIVAELLVADCKSVFPALRARACIVVVNAPEVTCEVSCWLRASKADEGEKYTSYAIMYVCDDAAAKEDTEMMTL